MRLPHVALALAMAAAFAAPALAQTALPGVAPKTPAMPAMTMPAKPATAMPTMAMPAKPAGMTGLVNINTATAAQLDAIPQIGEKRAALIIKNRPYKSVDELVSKKAISAGIFQKIKSYISV